MEGSIKELSDYRFERALEDFHTAKLLITSGQFKASVNRSYYSIFHAMRAITALDKFDSSKHSGIISYINKNYVKEGIFDKRLSKILDKSFRLREKADYQDFYIVSKEMAVEQLKRAEDAIDMVRRYLNK